MPFPFRSMRAVAEAGEVAAVIRVAPAERGSGEELVNPSHLPPTNRFVDKPVGIVQEHPSTTERQLVDSDHRDVLGEIRTGFAIPKRTTCVELRGGAQL